jgi:hypothetical protein
MLVERVFQRPGGVVRNDGLGALLRSGIANVVGIVSCVGNEELGRRAFQETVESMIRYSKSGSSDMASKTRSQTPFWLQRLKRRNTLFHSPKTSGRPRQGAPVRTIQSTGARAALHKHPVIAPR